jgi:hypothetical protein
VPRCAVRARRIYVVNLHGADVRRHRNPPLEVVLPLSQAAGVPPGGARPGRVRAIVGGYPAGLAGNGLGFGGAGPDFTNEQSPALPAAPQ